MSRSGSLTHPWADGEHTFRLGYGELRELQEKTDAGPMFLLNRLLTGAWMIEDVLETIRLGLIGAGMKPKAALVLSERYVKDVPDWLENANLARVILGAALMGVEDEPLGKDEAEGEQTPAPQAPRSPGESGSSAASTASASSSASAPAT